VIHGTASAPTEFVAEPAEPGAMSTVGPDVIVADLYQVTNHGVVGSLAALSIGTISCNIGNQSVDWEANTNRHPVIAQHLYRLKNGRFEQIGLSWLKHGFYATNGTTCFPACHGTDGSELGIHCSDPYSANLNGAQANLGPRYQVDAFSGSFPYPPANPAYSGILARRLQVRVNDLDHTMNLGAAYFLEGHYVTHDDAAAGNLDNNVSYRPAIVSGAGSSVFVQIDGQTFQEDPAILAWKRDDPAVVETNVRVPGEGLFILSAKATSLADGFWSYEYALYNMNSHRSAGSFRVPIDPTSSLRNIGFHDVDYHSGEPFAGTDWPASASPVSVTWSTQSHAQNPNANALRWGTLYNFRFEIDAPPQSTVVRIGLFRPGNPDFVDAPSVGPVTNAADCNLNEVADSIDILNGTSEDCDLDNVPDECEAFAAQAVLVASGLDDPVAATAPVSDPSRLFIVESGGRIRILKTGAVLSTPFLDISGVVGSGSLLGLAFDPEYATNRRFFIQYVNYVGDLVVVRYLTTANPEIADAGSAIVIKTIAQDGAGRNGGGLHFGPDGTLYVGMGDGGGGNNDPQLRAQDSGSLLGKMLRLDVDAPPNYIPGDNPFVSPGLPLDEIWAVGLGYPRTFSFDRETGDLYIADVGGLAHDEINIAPAGGITGANYGWRCMEGTTCTGLSGCTCNSPALTLPAFSYARSGGECSITGGYVYRGCALPNLQGTYFHADYCTGTIRSFRYINGVVSDVRDRTAELTPAQGPIGSIAAFAEDAAGELYMVSGDGDVYQITPRDVPPDVCGNGVLEPGETCDDGNFQNHDGCDNLCQIEPGIVNDACASAVPVSDGVVLFDSSDATTDGPNEPAACNLGGYTQVGSDVWYCYIATCTGTATISLCGSNYDTKLAVYDGCECPSSPGAVACNDNSCGTNALVLLPVSACESYLIRAGGRFGQTGSGVLAISCDASPPVNDCNGNKVEDAADIACGTSTDGNSNGVPDDCETNGDSILGGRLYDEWWTELGVAEPTLDHPLWAYRPDPFSNPEMGAATWRCKECHGWDYLGVNGQYAAGPHRTGFPGVLGTNLGAEALFTLLKEAPNNGGGPGIPNGHDYGMVLPDTRINDLVAFALSGAIDGGPYIAANGAFNGDPAAGQGNYTSGGAVPCMTCHGANGTAINFGTFDAPVYLGTVAEQNPWEMLHKIRFGQPAAPMPSWLAGGGNTQGAADIGRYIQLSFPTECVDDAQCEDGVGCTIDNCDGSGRCNSAPEGSLCSQDGVFCNGPEVCDPGIGCVSLGNPCAGSCDEADLCGCQPPLVTAPGGRYLTVTPQASMGTTMRFTITPVCAGAVTRWVSAPDPSTGVALLVDATDAAALTAGDWGISFQVTGFDIIPQTAYEVRAECGRTGEPFFTSAVTAMTQRWGDTVGTYSDGVFTPPNGLVSFQDITAVVDGFRNRPTAPPMPVLDLFGCSPDQRINFLDIAGSVDGFRGLTYAASSLCPTPCE